MAEHNVERTLSGISIGFTFECNETLFFKRRLFILWLKNLSAMTENIYVSMFVHVMSWVGPIHNNAPVRTPNLQFWLSQQVNLLCVAP